MFLHDQAEKTAKWFNEWNFDPIVIGGLWFFFLVLAVIGIDADVIPGVAAFVVYLSPIWLPVYLGVFLWIVWMHYIRFMFWFNQKWILLEITLPPEVEKSPLAMELFLTGIWNAGGESTFIARLWEGKFRAVWSLEIASNEGRVVYYLHTRESWRTIIESRLYGQYPEAKITEVDDYVDKVPYNKAEYDLWGGEFAKGEPGAMPFRTYIDYQLDKDTDTPENKVDPISNTLELMGSLGKDEYMWMQVIIRARKKDEWHGFYLSHDHWKEGATKKIKEITEGAVKRAQGLIKDEAEQKKVGSRGAMLLNVGEKDQIEAIERSLTKNVFECGIRVLYMAKKEKFHGINIGATVRFFDAFRYPNFNSIGITRGMSIFDHPWQDFGDIRANMIRRKLFFRYKHRAYFYVPYEQMPTMMTTEELATLWHFPGSWVKTPGVQRVSSRRADAPSNLPTLPS